METQQAGIRPWVIAENNWLAVRETAYEVALLPWGATEAHNFHLPYATDNYQVDAIAIEAGRLAWEQGRRVAVLPNLPFGVNTGQRAIPFCINMNPSTQALVLRDVIESVALAGVKKFVLLNGHGGNDFKQMLRELQAQFPDVFLSTVSWYNVLPRQDWFEQAGDHADEGETSLMLHLRPDLVLPLEIAGCGRTHAWRLKAFQAGWAWAQRDWVRATEDTGSGDPSAATAEKGQRFFEALTASIAEYLIELAALPHGHWYE